MNSSSGDLWYVKLADGDVHRVTLDQLDEAFQAGHIDGDTMVLAAGGSEWSKLGDLAGIDDDAVPVEAAPPVHSSSVAGYIPQVPPPSARTAPQYTAPAPAPYAQQPSYSASAYAATSYAPQPAAQPRPQYGVPSYSPAPVRAAVPNSLRPVSVDFGDDGDLDQLRRRGGGKKWVAGLLAVAAIGGAVATVAHSRPTWAQPLLNRLGVRSTEVAAAAAPPPPAAVIPPPVAAPAPVPAPEPPAPVAVAPAAPGADSPLNPHFTNSNDHATLSDDQKQRLLDADKKGHGRKGHAAGATHAGPAPKSKSTTFTTGGSKYDPLNSSI
jgi:hypothetical protein